MSVNLTKQELLVYFNKIDQYNYLCKKCNKPYKTPNGGIGNLKTHLATHAKDKEVPGKIITQTILKAKKRARTDNEDNEDDPQDIDTVIDEKT